MWGTQFVVQRIINEDGLNSYLVADDMGMGKVCETQVDLENGMLTIPGDICCAGSALPSEVACDCGRRRPSLALLRREATL